MNNSIPRRHHYIPQFYLAGFTPCGNKDDFLFVTDQIEGKQWKQKPDKVAHQRDLYILENPDNIEDIEIDAIEKAFGIRGCSHKPSEFLIV